MGKEKVSSGSRISKWLAKKELKVMALDLDNNGENWRYGRSKVGKKWAIFVMMIFLAMGLTLFTTLRSIICVTVK